MDRPLDCTLLIDKNSGKVIYKRGDCERRRSPNSTFKLPLALIGYDAGILIDEHTPVWPFQKNIPVNTPNDTQTTDPTLWEKNSVVWYSQKLTSLLGMEKFQAYINHLHYGNADLSGETGKNNGLTHAWLDTSLQISPAEQAEFVRNILNKKYDLSPKAFVMTEAILPRFATANGWTVAGKTGTGYLPGTSGGEPQPQGWFIGWAEKEGRQIVFVKYIVLEKGADKPTGQLAREILLAEFPQIAGGLIKTK